MSKSDHVIGNRGWSRDCQLIRYQVKKIGCTIFWPLKGHKLYNDPSVCISYKINNNKTVVA